MLSSQVSEYYTIQYYFMNTYQQVKHHFEEKRAYLLLYYTLTLSLIRTDGYIMNHISFVINLYYIVSCSTTKVLQARYHRYTRHTYMLNTTNIHATLTGSIAPIYTPYLHATYHQYTRHTYMLNTTNIHATLTCSIPQIGRAHV